MGASSGSVRIRSHRQYDLGTQTMVRPMGASCGRVQDWSQRQCFWHIGDASTNGSVLWESRIGHINRDFSTYIYIGDGLTNGGVQFERLGLVT